MKNLFTLLLLCCSCILSAQNNPNGFGGGNSPGGNQVVFYRDNNYAGMSRPFGNGAFGSEALGFLSGNISSIYIPNGYKVQVRDRFNRVQTFTSSVPNLTRHGWDNRITTGIISGGNAGGEHGGNNPDPGGNQVVFYRDAQYAGMSRAFGNGAFGAGNLGFLNGNISSIRIPAGYSVQVRDRTNRVRTFTASVPNLAQYGWDNRITTGIVSGGGNPGGNQPPQGSKVILYGDMKYSGMARDFGPGAFSAASMGFLAENVSSIYIPAGLTVKVYDRRNNSRTFNSSVSNLSQYGWDNKIYTGIISGSTGGGDQGGNTVRLYADPQYRGSVTPCAAGAINYIGAGAARKISSIQVPAGFAVTVYEGNNLSGNNRTFTSSVPNLSAYGWNDRITSVYVYRR